MAKAKSTEKEKDKEISIEQALERLEKYVEALETGRVSLDESFKIFEKAVKVSKHLQKKLDSYERKIEIITEENGDVHLDPFEKKDS